MQNFAAEIYTILKWTHFKKKYNPVDKYLPNLKCIGLIYSKIRKPILSGRNTKRCRNTADDAESDSGFLNAW